MTRDEAEKLDSAMRAPDSAYKDRMFNIDYINDNPEACSMRLIGHAPARERGARQGQEMRALSGFAETVLGRALRDEEMNVIVNPIPERPAGRALT
jgi:hypothetical protein